MGLPGVVEVPGRVYLSPLVVSGSLGIVDQIEIIIAVDDFVQPQVMLRWSDDGGHTWSNEHWRSMGGVGEYGKRVLWRRLGMTEKLRDRVYEISGTDPVKIAIMAAELSVEATKA